MTNQTELKARLLKRAESRKAYACHGARAYRVAESTTGYGRANESGERWLEHARASGVRFVGFADEIVRSINHKGWFTDHHQDDTFRGAVLQLPAHKGRPVYLAAYRDSMNGNDSYFVDSGIIIGDSAEDDDAKRDAALRADSFAENKAEEAREFYAKGQAETDRQSLAEEMHATRVETLALIRDAKMGGINFGNDAMSPHVRAAIYDSVKRAARELEEGRTRRAALAENYWLAVE